MERCHYIFNGEVRRGEPVRWCGRLVDRGSYCEEYWRLCHRPVTQREIESFAEMDEVAKAA